jgi:hypothetical protein
MVAVLMFVSLVAGSPPSSTLWAGFGLVFAYIVMRFSLLSIQMRERENEIKSIPSTDAERIIDETAKPEEKIALEKMLELDSDKLEIEGDFRSV